MIAAAKGHEKCVKKLIRLGADFWNDNEDSQSAIVEEGSEGESEEEEDEESDLESECSFISKS